MYSKTLLALVSVALIGNVAAEDAKIVENNPKGITYAGKLPAKPFFTAAELNGNVVGSISATAADNGVGTKFTVDFSNFPKSGGPFVYHIHTKPATNGNCTSTLGHLDPTNRGDKTPCDASQPATCQVGDLSGKYGKITTDPFTAEFTDPYTSLEPGNPAYFGDLSFVIHYANNTRLTCANFAKVDAPQYSQPGSVPECTNGGQPQPQSTGGYSSLPAQPESSASASYTTHQPSTSVQTVPSASGSQGHQGTGAPTGGVPITAGAAKMVAAAPVVALGAAVLLF